MIHGQILQLHGYGVSFGRRVILSSVDLTLPSSGIDVLMGPVKTGKSTLMRSLAGLNQGNALFRSWGQATLQGQPLAEDYRPALVLQHAVILNSSVRDALIYHRRQVEELSPAAWTDFAEQALSEYGIDKFVPPLSTPMLSLPLVWQRIVNILSYALARPKLLMIDEPTFGLDDAAATRLIDWLKMLGKTTRLLVTLHHQGHARSLADRVILLGGGRILAHNDNPRFFIHPANDWVKQFVRSGSLSIASPDAKPGDLNPDVPPPPPLPEQAIAVISGFAGAQITAVPAHQGNGSADSPVSKASIPGAVSTQPIASISGTHEKAPSATASEIRLKPKPAFASLPPLSPNGVEDASMVGRAIFNDYRGPQGFHWIVPGKLAGCAEPGSVAPVDYDMSLLASAGISHLITLTENDLEQETLARHKLHNLHLPIFDREAPSINQAYMLVRRMQVLLDKGHVLAVHCKAGIGRTGTILATWLIREGGLSASSGIERLRNINPAYVQTEIQEKFLHEFENDIVRRL